MDNQKIQEILTVVSDLSHKVESMKGQLDDVKSQISRLDYHITGNGTPENGIIVQLDRLKQAEAGRSKLVWVCVTAAIASFFNAIYHAVTK